MQSSRPWRQQGRPKHTLTSKLLILVLSLAIVADFDNVSMPHVVSGFGGKIQTQTSGSANKKTKDY